MFGVSKRRSNLRAVERICAFFGYCRSFDAGNANCRSGIFCYISYNRTLLESLIEASIRGECCRNIPASQRETCFVFENLSDNIVRAQHQESAYDSLELLLQSAMENPLFYPAAQQWMFPGDSLAIVLQSNLPQAPKVLQSFLQYISTLNIDSDDVVVVITAQMAQQFGIKAQQLEQSESEIANGMPPAQVRVKLGDSEISFQVHDPNNTYGLAYLAANEAGDPVHINRLLADADVVVPIGCPTPGSQQRYDCLYPDFGSAERLKQLIAGVGSAAQRQQEVDLANDNLGTFFSLEIVTGPGGNVAAVFAGARKDVFEQSKQLADELWTVKFIPDRQTVLATIEQPGPMQTWDDFTDAVISAARISNGSGPIAVWTAIDHPADRNTRKALMAQFNDSAAAKLSVRQRSLASIVSERPIFFRSELSQSQTEELGLGYIESESDVESVLAKFESGILLRDAHRCRIDEPQPASN